MIRKLTALVSRIRFRDIIIFQAPCVAGLGLFLPDLTIASLSRAMLVGLGSFLLMAYIFAFNDWVDITLDRENPHKRERTFLSYGISKSEMLMFSIVLALAGTILVGLVSAALAAISIVITIIWLIYSFPVRDFYGKAIPVFSSCLHFAGTLLAFLLGSMTFSPVSQSSLLIGLYFCLIINAGHFTQEIQDYEEDRSSHVMTNAVRFGKDAVFRVSVGLFSVSFLLLVGLAQARLVPAAVTYTILLFPVYAVLVLKARRAGLDRESVWRLRSNYRILYAIIVIVMLSARLIDFLAPGL
jgi:4-hydroxybenzoate polyprenyltransferase